MTESECLALLSADDRRYFGALFKAARRVCLDARLARHDATVSRSRRDELSLEASLVEAQRAEWQGRYLAIQRGPRGVAVTEALGPVLAEAVRDVREIADGASWWPA